MADVIITGIKFDPCTRRKSLVGFVDFIYKGKFNFTDVAVHERLDRTGYRLVYPSTAFPIDNPMQKEIDYIIGEKVRAQLNQGASNENKDIDSDPKTKRTSNSK